MSLLFRAIIAFLVVALAVTLARGADAIRLPVPAQPVAPAPVPTPAASDVRLDAELLYVIEADVPVLVFTSPGGSVKVTKDVGPLRVRGKFVGGSGVETKTFTAKHLVIVEAVKDGRDELIVVPVGAQGETEAKRVFIAVGNGPRPPPVDPKPDVKPIVNTFRVLFIVESAQVLTAKQKGAIYAAEVRDYLDAKCTKAGGVGGWVVLDKDTTLDKYEPTLNRMWEAVKAKLNNAIPSVAIEVNGEVEIVPLPSSAEGMLQLLKQKRGE